MSEKTKKPLPESSGAPDAPDEDSPLAQLAAERDGLQDQLLRAQAEFANYQKRVERDRGLSAATAKRDFLAELLPALDALDLAIKHAESTTMKGSGPFIAMKGPDPFVEGVKASRDAFEKALAAAGVERIPAEPGAGFDPDLHDVQATVEMADLADGAIVEELRPGYRLGKLVVRHSSVVVAKRPG